MKRKINISEKELDRDIVNLNLPEQDIISSGKLEKIYSKEMMNWIMGNDQKINVK